MRNTRQGVHHVDRLQSTRRRETAPRQNKEFCDRGRASRANKDSDSRANNVQNKNRKILVFTKL